MSISLVLDNNGIIQKSKEAKKEYGQARVNEQVELDNASNWIDNQADESNGGLSKLPTTKETKPYLPSGFSKKDGTNLDNGLVISDGDGNEYVWVEVPISIYDNEEYNTESNIGDKKPKNEEETDKIEYCLKKYAKAYEEDGYEDEYIADSEEGWFTGKTEYDNAKDTMLRSIFKNGGFYVGRYEAGIGEDEEMPVSKQNMIPYTNVSRTEAKKLAEKIYAGEYTSSLMFGIQWNLMLTFIQNKGGVNQTALTTDSTTLGNYSNNIWSVTNKYAQYNIDGIWNNGTYTKKEEEEVLLTTGASDSFAHMNIYDVAGNMFEWTLERKMNASESSTNIKLASIVDTNVKFTKIAMALDSPCVGRGGRYFSGGDDSPASCRCGPIINSRYGFGFRVTFY